MLVVAPGALAILTGAAISSESKDTVQVPNGLAFSEFKGYERWEIIGLSHGGEHIAVIVGNPAMIDAYKAGIPENGKPFPDGAKMAKIHWNAKTNEEAPGQPQVSGDLHDVDFMAKDRKRFADSGDGAMAPSCMKRPPTTGGPSPRRTPRHKSTMQSAALPATPSCRTGTTFSPTTRAGNHLNNGGAHSSGTATSGIPTHGV